MFILNQKCQYLTSISYSNGITTAIIQTLWIHNLSNPKDILTDNSNLVLIATIELNPSYFTFVTIKAFKFTLGVGFFLSLCILLWWCLDIYIYYCMFVLQYILIAVNFSKIIEKRSNFKIAKTDYYIHGNCLIFIKFYHAYFTRNYSILLNTKA